jgi:hypothetical protein
MDVAILLGTRGSIEVEPLPIGRANRVSVDLEAWHERALTCPIGVHDAE